MSIPAELALAAPQPSRQATLWLGAAMAVLAAHLAFAYVLNNLTDFAPLPEAAEQAMEIDLTPLPMTTPEAVASETLAEETIDPLKPVEEMVEQAEPIPVEKMEVAEAEPVERVEPRIERVEEEATPAETAEPDLAEPVETVQPEPEKVEPETAPVETAAPEPEIVVPEAVEPEVAEVLPERAVEPEPEIVTSEVVEALPEAAPQPQPRPVEQPVKKVEKPARKQAAKPPAKTKTQTAETTKKANAKPSASSQASKASTAPKVNPARWHSQVRAAVARRVGRIRGKSGTVNVSFVVNGSGAVVSASVARSSGDGGLDSAALSAVRSARVPAPPEGLGGRHSFSIPLTFR